ncbi:hypothetical protein R4J03_03500 [Brachyspira intermedia]|uniref:hypothetical protein n=1 Tax=Brachyspira intermedia TaxID=84377 RepID=UPI00262239BF|nr:hypothetical protein [uncultured Brachyspira sp.]
MSNNKYIIISAILLISSIIANLLLDYYIIPKRYILIDQSQHFYNIKKWYESGKILLKCIFIESKVIAEEFTTPRILVYRDLLYLYKYNDIKSFMKS